jgi:hypothetical protein
MVKGDIGRLQNVLQNLHTPSSKGCGLMTMRKKWIIPVSLSVVGMAMFMVASIMAGRFDQWQIAKVQGLPRVGGQFAGTVQEILHLSFFLFLFCSFVLGLIAFELAVLVKRRSRWLVRATYGTLFYWCGFIPVVAYMFIFPALALFGEISDWLKYMR